jgi:hypothetical protein
VPGDSSRRLYSPPVAGPQSHGTTVAFRGLPGKMPPVLRMMRCQTCPHDKRTHVTAWTAVFSIGVLAVTSCRTLGPQLGHIMRVRLVPGITMGVA